MIIRKADERGRSDFGWLDSRHSFSFGNYHDPEWMGFSDLRVINEDRVDAGRGFGTHPHRDMEIISYVIDGTIEHKDSMGNGSQIVPGDVQLMRAGTGITHSEFNPSPDTALHFLQIWIIPEKNGLEPAYEQAHFPMSERENRLRLVVSPDGAEGSLRIAQNARIYTSQLTGAQVDYTAALNRSIWVQVLEGDLHINDQGLSTGDGIGLSKEAAQISGTGSFLLFDLN